MAEVNASQNQKAGLKSMIEMLGLLLQEPMSRKELTQKLADEFVCTPRTVISRLDEITTKAYTFHDYAGNTVDLAKKPEKKEIIYFLQMLN